MIHMIFYQVATSSDLKYRSYGDEPFCPPPPPPQSLKVGKKPEEADRSKQGNLSFSRIVALACLPTNSVMAVL